jgi:hypothetical protein
MLVPKIDAHPVLAVVFVRGMAQIGRFPLTAGGDAMARKPNYDFERKERERLKAEKNAARKKAKEKPETAKPEVAQTEGDTDEGRASE